MNIKLKKTLFWILALFIVLGTSTYQRLTGPTYPKKETISLGGKEYKFKLLRSHGGESNCKFGITLDKEVSGKIFYRQYPTNQEYKEVELIRNGDSLMIEVPHQKPAGKLEYYLEFTKNSETIVINKDDTVVIRFKGHVPEWVLLPHIFFMFVGLLLVSLSAIFAIANIDQYKFYSILALISLFVGGLILGPIVQKFAFGEYWTGIPWGWDLTDNKTLVGFIAWLIAVLLNLKKKRKWAIIVGTIFILVVFSIPHSMHGSERNPESDEIISA